MVAPLTTFNLFTFPGFSSGLNVLRSLKSAMFFGSTEHRGAAAGMESLSFLGFSAGKTVLVLYRLFWVDIIGLYLSSDYVLVFFFR